MYGWFWRYARGHRHLQTHSLQQCTSVSRRHTTLGGLHSALVLLHVGLYHISPFYCVVGRSVIYIRGVSGRRVATDCRNVMVGSLGEVRWLATVYYNVNNRAMVATVAFVIELPPLLVVSLYHQSSCKRDNRRWKATKYRSDEET